MNEIKRKTLLSGITATGDLTIGNYLGAIKNFVKLQDENDMFVFVADLHALTIEIKPTQLRENRKKIMALYLAAGLDPKKTTIFFQSDVGLHGEMNWLLENQTTLGELSRMTQFKDKSQTNVGNGTTKIITGLLTYPALMAGDILLYNPDVVPVGKDQEQHIELTRNIAERFNNKYGQTFKMPEFSTPKVGSKIMSLDDPTKKMSKSSKIEKSYIRLLDDPQKAFNKIKRAMTDSEGKVYASKDKPGVLNLLTIYAGLKDISIKECEHKFRDSNYLEFKTEVGNAVKDFLINLQSRYEESLKKVDEIAEDGAKRARIVASRTLFKTKKRLGLN